MKYSHIDHIPEFDHHRLVTFVHDKKTGLRGFIAVHRGDTKRRAFGATRLWRYASEIDACRDALRLSRMMSYKAAMAGLPYGGAKGVILDTSTSPNNRRAILESYAKKVNYFGGNFITGTDVGLTQHDLVLMRKASPYMVGLKGDATKFTNLGILGGMQVCLEEVFGTASLRNRTFAIQGVGKIGAGVLALIYRDAASVFVSDVDTKRLQTIKKRFPRVRVVPVHEIHKQKVDVFAPCALSGSVNHKTIADLRASIVAGGANNQLEDSKVGHLLHRLGILYAPDYVINGGGLICVTDEFQHHNHDPERVLRRVITIKKTLREIFRRSKKAHRPTHVVADEMAEEIIKDY